MENKRCEGLRKDIIEIRQRIIKRQNKFESKCSTKASTEYEKQVFDMMLDINRKLDMYSFVESFAENEFDFVNLKLNTKSIVRKTEKMVKFVKQTYYPDVAITVMKYIFQVLMKNKALEEQKGILNELKEQLECYNFIQNHTESSKVSNIMDYVNALNEIYVGNSFTKDKLYILYGIKRVISEYYCTLNNIEKVEDESLKRAVLTYISGCMDIPILLKIAEDEQEK